MKNLSIAAIIIVTFLLAAVYAIAEQWIYGLVIAGLGVIWLFSVWRNFQELISTGLIVFIGVAAWGIYQELSTIWMLIAVVVSLVAWDLARFSQRIAYAEPFAEGAVVQQAHLQRLAMVGGLGLLLGGLALGLQFQLNFGWAVLLGLVMVISLAWVVGRIRRNHN